MIPQIIMIIFMVMSIGFALAKDGQPKTDKHSFGWSLVVCVIYSLILWWGGFWNVFRR